MSERIHSVELDRDKCVGCTNCVKRCPTEAIRVRNGRAVIIGNRCIDCGECIRHCPHKAKKPLYDKLESISEYRYKIALPAPALLGQFDNLDDADYVLNGLLAIGFDDVYEVSQAAELISEYTRRFMETHADAGHPFISTACPAVVRLIAVRFPYLRNYLLPILPPVELAAREARARAKAAHPDLSDEDIGVFFISPCPAKVTYARSPIGVEESALSGVLSISEIYFKLVSAMKKLTYVRPLSHSGVIGISWATSGGESAGLLDEKYLAADGIENVIKVLDEIENENYSGLTFIELNACSSGCVGGTLTVENPFIAKARIQKLRRFLPISQNRLYPGDEPCDVHTDVAVDDNPAMKLDDDKHAAIEMRAKIQSLAASLPGLDCGACGAPSCRALAEDIVCGNAQESNCIFKMREKIQSLYESMAQFGFMESLTDEKKDK